MGVFCQQALADFSHRQTIYNTPLDLYRLHSRLPTEPFTAARYLIQNLRDPVEILQLQRIFSQQSLQTDCLQPSQFLKTDSKLLSKPLENLRQRNPNHLTHR